MKAGPQARREVGFSSFFSWPSRPPPPWSGLALLIEDSGEELPALLDPVIGQQFLSSLAGDGKWIRTVVVGGQAVAVWGFKEEDADLGGRNGLPFLGWES